MRVYVFVCRLSHMGGIERADAEVFEFFGVTFEWDALQ